VHGLVLVGPVGLHLLECPAARVVCLPAAERRRDRLDLLPAPQGPELRVERQHVGERRGARAGQAVDVDRPAHGDAVDLGMLGVPRLDLEAVDEPPAEVADHGRVGVGTQVAVALEAVEQHHEPVPEVAGTEVGATGLGGGLVEQLVSGGIAPHRLSSPPPDRESSRPPAAGTRPASRPGTAR
jgi:hypothetical protein